MVRLRLSRVRTIALAILLPSVVALAACESRPPPTAPEAPASGRTTITPAGVVHGIDDSNPEGVVDYWTPERMKSARPVEPAPILVPPRAEAPRADLAPAGFWPSHLTGHLTRRLRRAYPHTSIGKVFFTLLGFDFVCSASAITGEGRWGKGPRNLVLTAGHCLSDGAGTFATNFVFVPGYHRGNAPYGMWPAKNLFTTFEWHTGFGLAVSRDVAFAQMAEGTGEYAGLELHDVVDPLGIIFTRKYPKDGLRKAVKLRKGVPFASFGYGVDNWGGEEQVGTLSLLDTFDPNFLPSPIGMPSTHTGGASGGPWLYRYAPWLEDDRLNLVTSVNSYVYNGIDRMHGPQFDDAIHDLWMFAATH